MNSGSAGSLMEKLKESTRAMHDSAEASAFQGKLTNGALPKELYVLYLEQLYLVHRKLEECIKQCAQQDAKFSAIVSSEQLQEPFLKLDLQSFNRNIEAIQPLSSTTELLNYMEELSKTYAPALLGMHYVLLGSKHGGKFVAKNCQESYQLNASAGAKYFDPYGQNFMPIWKDFKESMNQLSLEDGEEEQFCGAAAKMFLAVTKIGNELMPKAKI
ncbi:MAG: biliverdin-producing heme oxygenase [Candidatus Obscuribacterales bacterium]|nr:biliverdin-producing heme oxygenase [Candidatus Obscuribacterales bacterium]